MEFLKEELGGKRGEKKSNSFTNREQNHVTETLSDADMWTDRKSTHGDDDDDAAAIFATAILK